jgi:hypothetical protein
VRSWNQGVAETWKTRETRFEVLDKSNIKKNQAYAHSEEIDPVGRDLYSLIKKQLPDGLRWVNKDIEVLDNNNDSPLSIYRSRE